MQFANEDPPVVWNDDAAPVGKNPPSNPIGGGGGGAEDEGRSCCCWEAAGGKPIGGSGWDVGKRPCWETTKSSLSDLVRGARENVKRR